MFRRLISKIFLLKVLERVEHLVKWQFFHKIWNSINCVTVVTSFKLIKVAFLKYPLLKAWKPGTSKQRHQCHWCVYLYLGLTISLCSLTSVSLRVTCIFCYAAYYEYIKHGGSGGGLKIDIVKIFLS